MLNGTNFKDWKENMMILLGCMDIDLALRMPKPDELNKESTQEDEVYWGKWERSNRLSLMIMKRGIPESFRGAVSDKVTTANKFLTEIEKKTLFVPTLSKAQGMLHLGDILGTF